MTAIKKIFLDETYFYSLDVSPTDVNAIRVLPLSFMVAHDGTTLGLQTIALQGVEMAEVIFADMDLTASIDSYTVEPTTNQIMFIVDKTIIDTEAKAIDFLIGLLVKYQMVSIEYLTSTPTYAMTTLAADGTFVGETAGISTDNLVQKILCLDNGQNINAKPGYYYHVVQRTIKAS